MSSIQGVSSSAPTYTAPKPQAAASPEAKETVQVERDESARNTQEAGERQTPPPPSGVGSKINLTA